MSIPAGTISVFPTNVYAEGSIVSGTNYTK